MEQTVCPFCNKPNFADRIIYEDEHHYVIASVGQMLDTGGYVLVFPKTCVRCVAAMGDQDIFFLSRMEDKIIAAMTKAYGETPTRFEHGIVGQSVKHAHVHFIPKHISMTQRIKADFRQNKPKEIGDMAMIAHYYRKKRVPYLTWTDNSKLMVCWNPPAPRQYLRIVGADELGVPERADWTKADKEIDHQLRQLTVQTLKPYF